MVMAKIKQEYKSNNQRHENREWNVKKLQTQKGKKEYREEINKQIEVKRTKEDIEREWKNIEYIIIRSAEKTIGCEEKNITKPRKGKRSGKLQRNEKRNTEDLWTDKEDVDERNNE
ncbi:hypothetical protein FQA39_LY00802 [Lamprigera yunnana]|nr:hypothetical protein FQA39_LY00802 [Lamprigera yunnana]